MQTWIELSRENLRHNFRVFADMLGRDHVAPVLKSNAYGHGLSETYQALSDEKPSWLAINYVEEGVQLRTLGFPGRIVVVGPFVPGEMSEASSNSLELLLGHEEGLEAWLSSSHKPKVHIEFDTGMSRQGFHPDRAVEVATRLLPFRTLLGGVCMHFANVEDVTEHDYALLQLTRYEQARQAFVAMGFTNFISHTASSASALILDRSRFDLARVGISLYGFWPSQATKISFKQLHGSVAELRPVLSWKTIITSINQVAQGQYIGYGCTYKASHPMRIGILPVGYFEGYPRAASGSQAYVIIHGERCPIVGRICMNMMMVDLTDMSRSADVGDVVTLIGSQGSETVSAADLGVWSGTIHYEISARLNSSLVRRVI